MKNLIKSTLTIGLMLLLGIILSNNNTYAQGRGNGKGIKSGTGTTHGINWVDANGDGVCDNFVDTNGDGINDNPHGFRGGNGMINHPANGIGRFGSASGVCDGTGKGRRGVSGNSLMMKKSK